MQLVRVSVMMPVALGAAGHFFQGNDASVQLLATCVLKLDGGVADIEMFFQNVIQLEQDAGAGRRRNICDGDVAGQGA